jgi:hypothetical protein
MMQRDQIESEMIVLSMAMDKLRSMHNLDHAITNAPSEFIRKTAQKNFDITESEYKVLLKEIK